jgi:ferredoxin-type protein NapH
MFKLKHILIQILRRCVQLWIVLFLLGLIGLNLYAHYRAARALEDLDGFKGQALNKIGSFVEESEDPQKLLDSFSGTLWSMKLAGVDISDPLAGAEMLAASKRIYLPMLASILIPVIITIIFGKVFCSWCCPAYLLLEISDKFRKILRFAEIPPGDMKFSYRNKYIILGVGLAYSLILSLPLFSLIYPPAVVSRLLHAWIFGATLTGMLIILGLIGAVELFVSPRWWCRTMCPGGALYGMIGYKRFVKVTCDTNTCNNCKKCEPACQMGLNPVEDVEGIECDNCAACIRHCPQRSLGFTLNLPKIKSASAKKQGQESKTAVEGDENGS